MALLDKPCGSIKAFRHALLLLTGFYRQLGIFIKLTCFFYSIIIALLNKRLVMVYITTNIKNFLFLINVESNNNSFY